MTARKKAGQEGFAQEVERLMAYARAAEGQDNWKTAGVYYRRALDLTDEAGLSAELREEAAAGLARVSRMVT